MRLITGMVGALKDFIVDINDESIIEVDHDERRFSIRQDVADWIKANIKGDWCTPTYATREQIVYLDDVPNAPLMGGETTYEVIGFWFEDINDAILFKLTWGGNQATSACASRMSSKVTGI